MKKIKTMLSLFATLTLALVVSATAGAATSVLTGHVELFAPITVGLYSIALVSNYSFPNFAFATPGVFTEGICEKIQTSLNDLMGSNSPEKKRTPVGYLQAITSPTNTAGLSVIPIDLGNGKKRSVRVTYAQRGSETDIQSTANDGCTAEIYKTPYEEIVSIEDVMSTKGIAFSEEEMAKLCESDASWIARIISAEFDPFMTTLNKALITKQASNFGNFADGTSTVHTRQLLVAATQSPYYYGENQIMNDFEDINFTGRPMLIGGGKLRDYTRISKIGCCNAQGIDLGQAGDFDYFNDRHVGTILGGADEFIGLAPGNTQLLTFNKYRGPRAKNFGNVIKTTIMDPFTGILLDMNWKYNDCDEVWILTFSLNYNMFFLPTNAFATGDELDGVNYSLHYKAIQA